MKTQLRIHAQREPFINDLISIRIAAITDTPKGQTTSIAAPIEFRLLTEKDMAVIQPATLDITPSSAQQFMDELWRCGIRPTEGAGSAGQMAATERHLEDMRKLVFEKK